MKRLGIILTTAVLVALLAPALHARPIQRPNAKGNAKGAAVPIQSLIVDYYVSRLPVEVELSDDQLPKVLVLLRQWLEERRNLEPKRNRAMNQLRQALLRNAPEEELNRLTHEADQALLEQQASRQKFLASVDPLLNVRQRARLRVFQENTETRILRMIEASRAATQQQRNAGAPPRNP